mgnify:CR=1
MITKEKQQVLDFYNEGLIAYKQQKWDDAIKHFSDALAIDPKDGPSKLYLERAQAFKETPPPEDWDGVFTMTTK